MSPYIYDGYNKVHDYIKKYSPPVVYQGVSLAHSFYKKLEYVANGTQKGIGSYLQPYLNKFYRSKAGKAYKFCYNVCKYPFGGIKWLAKKTIVPSYSYIRDKIADKFKKTSIYEAYRKGEDMNSINRMSS